MKTILAIIGESGTGKTHMANYLEKEYDIPYLQSHTDRPKRTPTETGHTWHTKKSFDHIKQDNMIAYTVYGGYRYCATHSQVEAITTYVVDEPGLDILENKFSKMYNILSFRIKRDVSNIATSRAERNIATYTREDSEFTDVINNNSTIKEFESTIDNIIETWSVLM